MTDFATLDSTIGDIELTPSILAQGFGQCNGRDGMPLDARHLNAVLKLFCACLIKPGMIQIWHFETGPIPAGWVICDGENGTPNFADRFIVAAGADYAAGDIGGADTPNTDDGGDHNHGGKSGAHTLTTGQMPAHTHDIEDPGHEHDHADTFIFIDTTKGANLDNNPPYIGDSTQSPIKQTKNSKTGIEIKQAGEGLPHDHAISDSGAHNHKVDVRPRYYAAIWIMKT